MMRFCAIATAVLLLGGLSSAFGQMISMEQVGPQSRSVFGQANVVRVSAGGPIKTVAAALESINDASPTKRYAILVAAGTYNETPLKMKQHVDLYGGFPADGGDWKTRDIYVNRTILDGHKNGPVVIGADDARLDSFVVT